MTIRGILILIFSFFCLIQTVSGSDFVVVIDPGHGGSDGGATRGKHREKDINLAVALELGRLIEQNLSDVKVSYTRKTDKFIELDERAKTANKAKANLFISIHVNATDARETKAIGAETYILGLARSKENLAVAKRENSVIKLEEDYTTKYEGFDPDSPESSIIFEFMTNQYMQQSMDVATLIQKKLKGNAKRVDRGVRQANFLVLRACSMPSVLVELGFINNATDREYMITASGQKTLAKSIYEGFKEYKEYIQERTVTSYTKDPVVLADANKQLGDGQVRVYRIQYLYSPTKLKDDDKRFKGLVPTGYIEEKGFKYYYGNTTDYSQALGFQEEVRKTFADAFLISTVDNVELQTSVNETSSTFYKVQFLTSNRKLDSNNKDFQGMSDVEFYKEGNLYKYICGSTQDEKKIQVTLSQVKKKYKDAFVIGFKNGVRIF